MNKPKRKNQISNVSIASISIKVIAMNVSIKIVRDMVLFIKEYISDFCPNCGAKMKEVEE